MLRVKLLEPGAKLPEVAHAGEDLGYDLFALEDTVLPLGVAVAVRTGIAAQFRPNFSQRKFGLLVKDRSSMAAKGIKTSAGVIDAGYDGEIKVLMTNHNEQHEVGPGSIHGVTSRITAWSDYQRAYRIVAGQKIAQMVPTEVFTAGTIVEVDDLGQSTRGAGGFGSSGS